MIKKPTSQELAQRIRELEEKVAEYMKVEEAQAESEKRYRTLFKSTPVGLGIADIEGNLIDYNDAMLRPGRYQREDLPEITNMADLYYDPDDRNKVIDVASRQGFVDDFEVQFKRKDGTPYDALLSLRPVVISDKRCWYAMVQDITARKATEDALRTSEAKHKTLVENIPGMIYRAYPDWSADIISGSELICGYTGEEIDRKEGHWLSLVHPEDREKISVEGSKLTKERSDLIQTYRIETKSGDIRWVEDRKRSLFSQKGEFLGIEGVVFDITERVRVEEELKKSTEQLRDLSEHLQSARETERAQIARDVHDELGQNLAALKMDISWLEKRLSEDQNPQNDTLKDKMGSISKLLDTTVQTVKRISSELRPPILDDFGLSAAIEWLAGDFENRTGIRCVIEKDIDEPVVEDTIATPVFRIFQEALSNIHRHSGATRIQTLLNVSADSFQMVVEDNGRGITNEEISDPRSFGLVGIRERVLLLGGEVEIKGIPNKGTILELNIPIRKTLREDESGGS